MKKIALLLLTCISIATLSAQNISLTQKRSDNDVEVISGEYTLHFRPADMVAAIAKIDSVTKTDHSQIANSISKNEIKFIKLSSTSADDKLIVDLVKSNLGSYLLSRGKVTVTKANKPLTKITADESPEMVELDGTSNVAILYSEGEEAVFLGKLNAKLRK